MTKKDQLIRKQINKRMYTIVNQTNRDLLQMFKSTGINYVPFKVTYHEYETPTEKGYRPVKNVTVDIDPKFLTKLFEDKIGFDTWLSRNHPKVARQQWKYLNLGHEQPQLKQLRKKYHKEVGDKAKPEVKSRGDKETKGGRINQKKVNMVAYVQEKTNPEKPKERLFESFTSNDVKNFMENEDFIFKGNLNTFFKNTSDKRIKLILKESLKRMNETFMNLELMEPKNDDTDYHEEEEEQSKFLSEIDGMKQQWRVQPKFPNIRNIRDWFIRTGIYNSYKLDQFNNIKTVKGRMNWIDRSVFLIANGVYANSLGQRTASWSGKYKQSAGAKIPLSKARKAKRFKNKNLYTNPEKRNKYRTERQIKYEQWNIDNRKIAAGWKNSGAVYSRVNRKSGNSRAQADSRKDNRQ